MGFLSRTTEIIFRGALASYLLLYALDIKSHSIEWTKIISENVLHFASYLNMREDQVVVLVKEWVIVYCQWLVLSSLMVVSGLKTGKVLGCLALILNWVLCWKSRDMLWIGTMLAI